LYVGFSLAFDGFTYIIFELKFLQIICLNLRELRQMITRDHL